MPLVVRGATLAGLAVAARLARLGHDVVLATGSTPLGERWAGEAMPPTIALPATWRDLFKKTGSHLQTVLNRRGLELVPAPPTLHRLPSGRELLLPHDRAGQYAALTHTLGQAAATGWRDLLDRLDREWAAFRRHTMDHPSPPSAVPREQAWLDATVADLGRALHDDLARMLIDAAPSNHAPAMEAFAWTVQRTFGLWRLRDADDHVQPGALLVSLLGDRLHERGVTLVEDAPDTDVDCRPHVPPAPWWRGGVRPRPAPTVHSSHRADRVTDVAGVVDHTPAGAIITWFRPTFDGTVLTIHDHTTTRPDPSWGVAPRTAAQWRRLPGITEDRVLRASSCSPAGAQPWAELSSAALAVYELHRRLTGEDCSPHNTAFTMPRLPGRDPDPIPTELP